MIKNEQEYKVTQEAFEKFVNAERLLQIEINAVKSEIEVLAKDLRDYHMMHES